MIPFPQSGPTRALGQTHSLESPASSEPPSRCARMLVLTPARCVRGVDPPSAGRVGPGKDYWSIQGYFRRFSKPSQRCSRVVLVGERGPNGRSTGRMNNGKCAGLVPAVYAVPRTKLSSKPLPLLIWRRRRTIVAQSGLRRSMPRGGRGGRESHGGSAIRVGLSVPKPQCHPSAVDEILELPSGCTKRPR